MAETNSITKVCKKCESVKHLGEFNRNKSKSDGLSTYCRACMGALCKDHYLKNKESYSEKSRLRYLNDPEKYKTRNRKWASENKSRVKEWAFYYRLFNVEKNKARQKEDYDKHKVARLATAKEYREAYPERNAEKTRRKQARKVQAMPKWADKKAIKAIYAECRRISQETGVKHHVDHFYPIKNTLVCGLHNQYNLQIIPAADNQAKGNSFPTEE